MIDFWEEAEDGTVRALARRRRPGLAAVQPLPLGQALARARVRVALSVILPVAVVQTGLSGTIVTDKRGVAHALTGAAVADAVAAAHGLALAVVAAHGAPLAARSAVVACGRVALALASDGVTDAPGTPTNSQVAGAVVPARAGDGALARRRVAAAATVAVTRRIASHSVVPYCTQTLALRITHAVPTANDATPLSRDALRGARALGLAVVAVVPGALARAPRGSRPARSSEHNQCYAINRPRYTGVHANGNGYVHCVAGLHVAAGVAALIRRARVQGNERQGAGNKQT